MLPNAAKIEAAWPGCDDLSPSHSSTPCCKVGLRRCIAVEGAKLLRNMKQQKQMRPLGSQYRVVESFEIHQYIPDSTFWASTGQKDTWRQNRKWNTAAQIQVCNIIACERDNRPNAVPEVVLPIFQN